MLATQTAEKEEEHIAKEESYATLNKKAIRASYWLISSNFAIQLISWLITILVARILSPDDYGLMGMAFLLTYFCSLFSELGIGSAIVQKRDLTKEQLSSSFWTIVIINLALYSIAFVSAPLAAAFFDEERLIPIIRILGLNLIIGGIYNVPYNMLTKELMFARRCIADFVSRLLGAIVTLSLAFLGYGVWSLVYGSIVWHFTKMICVFPLARWVPGRQLSFRSIKGMANYGYKVTATSVLWYFYTRADHLIIGRILGKISLGYYSLAFQLASLPGEKFLALIGKVTFPLFSKLQDDEPALQNYYLRTIKLIAFIAFPTFTGMFLVAPSAVILFLSEKWSPIILPFRILCFTCMLGTLASFSSHLVNAKGRPGVGFFNMLICSIIMPIGFLIGSRYGLEGVSYSWLFLYPIVFLIITRRSIKVINLTLSAYLKNLISPFITTSLMAASVYLSQMFLPHHLNSILLLILYCFVGAAAYSVSSFIFARELLSEIKNLVRRR